MKLKVINPRPKGSNQELSQLIKKAGFDVVEIPAIKTKKIIEEELEEIALKTISKNDWVFFTSKSGINFLSNPELIKNANIAVIGDSTKAAAQKVGLRVSFVSKLSNSIDMGREFTTKYGKIKAKALLYRAETASGDLKKVISPFFNEVIDLKAYGVYPIEYKLLFLKKILPQSNFAVLATSGLTLKATLNLYKKAGIESAFRDQAQIITIGPTTTKIARSLSLKVKAEAKNQTNKGLLDALPPLLK